MKKSTRQQSSKIKREYEIYKEFKKIHGLTSSNYINIKEMRRNLKQTTNLVKRNE